MKDTSGFFIGHRGCGKSSFLKRLMSTDRVKSVYDPILFSISDVLDLTDLSYQDVIFAISSTLVEHASETSALTMKNHKAFLEWGRTFFEEEDREEGAEVEVEGGISAIIAKFMVKLKTQYSFKTSFRVQIEPKITDLIGILNEVTLDIENASGKKILLAIDDLDKASPEAARNIFGQSLQAMLSPSINIIYTVPVSLMHETEWQGIKDSYWYMPNIKIFDQHTRNAIEGGGFDRMKEFVERRMMLQLIEPAALEKAILYGGGVFRQTCRIIQRAIGKADDSSLSVINEECIDYSISEYSNGMLPQLTKEDMDIMIQVYQDSRSLLAFERPKLMYNMSILMYPGSETWMDVNPILWSRVNEYINQ